MVHLCVNLTGPRGAQIFDQILFWVFLDEINILIVE